MEKMTMITLAVAVLLIGGAIFASANYLQEKNVKEVDALLTCGPKTCNQQCGGDCGISECGCSSAPQSLR